MESETAGRMLTPSRAELPLDATPDFAARNHYENRNWRHYIKKPRLQRQDRYRSWRFCMTNFDIAREMLIIFHKS